jgi:hypothetical protein
MYSNGFKEYFHHRWNLFDFTIVFVSTSYSLLAAFIDNCKEKFDERIYLKFIFCFSNT